ncbi:glycosyltransferase [Roseateles sp. 22389]|uniref:glycosyltransferase n=1 Tax=Roseateles sp. 22389 TaxID=3453916 RepID=UPI003F87575B
MSVTLPAAPTVSWVLCTNRLDALLDRAIASCLDQTLSDFELLIVTNGPDAASIATELRRRHAMDTRVRVIVSSLHLLNFNLSLGLHEARGRYIARMDADDISTPDRLALQVDHLMRHPRVVAVGSNFQWVDATGQRHQEVRMPVTDEAIRRQLYWRNPLCHPSVMFRREVVATLGGYLGGRNAEDYDLWARLSLQPECEFANIDRTLLFYNVEPTGPARRSRDGYANMAAAQLRNFLISGRLLWLVAVIVSCVKLLLRTRRH